MDGNRVERGAARRGAGVLPRVKRALVPLGLRLGSFHAYKPRRVRPPGPGPVLPSRGLPRVTVVIPSFNQGRFLGAAIESVLGQGYPDLELIVRDGGSTDGSADVIARHAHRLRHWASVPDGGQAEGINLGFAHGTGAIMAWLNADDLLLPGAVGSAVDHFMRNPRTDVVYGHRVIIDERGMEVGRWVLPRHRASALLWRDYVPQETMFWRRSIWERVGGRVNEEYQFALDWELVARFHRAGARFVRLPRFMACFRTHDEQKSLAQRAEVGEPEFAKVRAMLMATRGARLRARVGGLAYLGESAAWTWAHGAGLTAR